MSVVEAAAAAEMEDATAEGLLTAALGDDEVDRDWCAALTTAPSSRTALNGNMRQNRIKMGTYYCLQKSEKTAIWAEEHNKHECWKFVPA